MKRLLIRFRLVVLVVLTTMIALATSAVGHATVVVGTGNPDIDVPAVQAAVDQGGRVILKGHFSFDRPPTVPTAIPWVEGLATVLVSKAVAISGALDQDEDGLRHGRGHGEMTTIEGGTTPFYVEAPGARVAIQGLRFIRPKGDAIFVYAVSGLVIASCKIEGLEPLGGGGQGIAITTVNGPPSPTDPGKPENISGTLLIANNHVDIAETQDNSSGVLIFSVGVTGAEADIYISGNTIRNTTERTINLYQIGGRASIEDNVVTTSTNIGTSHIVGCRGTDVIHVTGTGAYLVARNSIHSRWAAAGGIRVDGTAIQPTIDAVVVENDVNMEAPEDAVFDRCSAGISIFGPDQGSIVLDNRIRGRAGSALALLTKPIGVPTNSAVVRNRLDDFQASVADVFVEEGVMNTQIMGPGTIEDHGVGTVIVRLPFDHHHDEGGDEDRNK